MPVSSPRGHERVYAVVLAGGFGTRFWPRSRRRMPKQFLTVTGKRSMLQETVSRLHGVVRPEQTLVVAAPEFMRNIRRQLPGVARDQLLAEPAARGTAACIALAAEWIARRDPHALMAVFPSDHSITDAPAFRRALRRALAIAEAQRCLVTFGVPPSSADTGYGYIELGRAIDRQRPLSHWVARFHEKPSAATAKRYLKTRRFRWNSGMFVWRVDVLREAFSSHAPATYATAARVVSAPASRGSCAAYRRLSALSIDVAVLERAERVAVVEGDFGWSDVGSWATLAPLWGTDSAGNAVRGPAIVIDSQRVLVFGAERMIAAVGMSDAVIVDSPDALLVVHRDRAQDVRRVVDELRRRRLGRLL